MSGHFRRSITVLAAAIAWLVACNQPASTGQEAQVDPAASSLSRETVQTILGDARAIKSQNGIEDLKSVEIGGITQWISVRGRDRDNPILLFIHGGPGTTEMPVSWFYQTPLEDYFTVVQWDQRGSGKTAVSNTQTEVLPTITVERMINDTDELVAYLRETYNKEKVFILGHSWGTLLGLEMALKRPEWLHAYVGMGQLIYAVDNEALGYQFALEQARQNSDEAAILELESIAPYPKQDSAFSVAEVITQRRWVSAYGGMTQGRPSLDFENNLRQFSPDYTQTDLDASAFTGAVVLQLLPQLMTVDYRNVTELDVPVFLFSGRHDYAVPSSISKTWLASLDAPQKELIWFEHSAHLPHFEQPGSFVFHLIRDVRPLAD